MGISHLIELKTLREKEKLLVTSNFSFYHYVFKSCLLFMRQNKYLWSKGLKITILAGLVVAFFGLLVEMWLGGCVERGLGQLVRRLIDWSIDWLIDRSIDWLIDWLM